MATAQITGNMTAAPELKAFPRTDGSQELVVEFSLADTKRVFNRDTNTWTDGKTSFHNVKAFGALAQHIAASLQKGQAVIVLGEMTQETWDLKDETTGLPNGKKGSKIITTAQHVGPSLQFGTTTFQKQSATQVAQAPTAMAQAAPVAQPVMQAAPLMQAVPVAQPVMQAAPVAQPVMQAAPVAQPVMQAAPAAQPVAQAPAAPVAAANGAPIVF